MSTTEMEQPAEAQTPVKMWAQEIESAKEFMKPFQKEAKKINRRYLDKRDAMENSEYRVNLFWSTIKVVMSMLYARPPKVAVSREFADYSDDVARVAAEILERLLNNDVQADGATSRSSIRLALQDWATLGLGQVWSRYEVQTQPQVVPPVIDPMTGMEMQPAEEYEQIVDENAPIDYVFWDDFLYSPCRIWADVRWVARRVYMTRDELVARFGEEVGQRVPMAKTKPKNEQSPTGTQVPPPRDPWSRAKVWEIWDKSSRSVVFYAEGCDFLLDEVEDPLGLEEFFPCPEPLAENTTTTEFLPRSDYVMAQDQFDQLDEINTRISWLTKGMKLVGVYDKSAEGVQRMLNQATENQLIPVDNWALFSESGGLKGKVEWMPIQDVAAVLERLVMLRDQVKGQIYEVLGISDIMRGSSKASETASAQQLKAQFGSTRISEKQQSVAMFVQRVLSIKAEIIEKHFQPQIIAQRSNIMLTPDAQLAQPAIEMLKSPAAVAYKVKVQAETMAYQDQQQMIGQRTEALTAMGQFMQQAHQAAQVLPQSGPLFLEMLKWYMTSFHGFHSIEGVLDKAIEQANKALMAPKQPDPKEMAEVQRDYAEIEEKKAGALERRAGAAKDLAETALKAREAGMGMPPVPPEMFLPPGGGQPVSPGAMGAPIPSAPEPSPSPAASPVNPPPPQRPPMPGQTPTANMPPPPQMPPGGQP